jgi:hypothetical protein
MHPGVAITRTFVRFTFGLPLLLAMIATALLMPGADSFSRGLGVAWILGLVLVLCVYWNKDHVNEVLSSVACLPGAILFVHLMSAFLINGLSVWFISVLSGSIAVLVVYDTALGHWFLETRGRVPVGHLMTGVKLLWSALILRLGWDLVQGFRLTAYAHGEPVSLLKYMIGLDGFFLLIGILMGTLLPCVLMWFVYQTLKISSTTSATGVLYGTMLCVLMGDLIYRYYLVAESLPL